MVRAPRQDGASALTVEKTGSTSLQLLRPGSPRLLGETSTLPGCIDPRGPGSKSYSVTEHIYDPHRDIATALQPLS